jgi:hypothetical protein
MQYSYISNGVFLPFINLLFHIANERPQQNDRQVLMARVYNKGMPYLKSWKGENVLGKTEKQFPC